jgi:hypothetical protein
LIKLAWSACGTMAFCRYLMRMSMSCCVIRRRRLAASDVAFEVVVNVVI